MGNTGSRNTGGSQFFINVADNSSLDWFTGGQSRHIVFGKIIEGYDIVYKISNIETVDEKPAVPIKMDTVSLPVDWYPEKCLAESCKPLGDKWKGKDFASNREAIEAAIMTDDIVVIEHGQSESSECVSNRMFVWLDEKGTVEKFTIPVEEKGTSE